MATINVLDAGGTSVAIEKPLTPGRAAAASSRPVALSTEDFNVLAGPTPAGTNVIGKVTIDQTTPGTTNAVQVIGGLPTGSNALGSVTVSNLPTTQAVSGSVSVSNFPATQTVSGSVSVTNFPATQTVQSATLTPTAGTNLGGTVTTTSGGFSIPANSTRRPGDIQGQNTGANPIAFNEFGGTAVIGGTASAPTGDANSYVVLPGNTFSITTNRVVNFVALTGSSTVAITSL